MKSLFLISSLACLATCAPTESVNPSAAEITSAPAVISLHDTTTELIVALGATEHLIAITEPGYLSPAAKQAVANVPRLPSGPVSAEALLGWRPNLILGTDAVEERQADLRPQLERLGVKVTWLDPNGMDGLYAATRQLGALVHAEDQAELYITQLQTRVEALTEATPIDSEPVRVFFFDCCDPPFTAGGRIPLSDLLHRIGARNVFKELDQDWVAVSWESVVLADPELIVVHDYSWGDQASSDGKTQRLYEREFLNTLTAVRNDNIVVLPLGIILEGPLNLDALELLTPYIQQARKDRDEAQK